MKEEDSQNYQQTLQASQKGYPVDPIVSPFDSGGDKVPGEETYVPYRPPEQPFSPDQDLDPDSPAESSGSP